MGRRRCYFCGTAYTGTKCGKFGFFWRVGMTPGMTMHISSIFSWEPNTKISKEIASEKTIGVAEEGRILELAWSTRTRNPSDDARAHTHTHTPPSSHNTQHNTIHTICIVSRLSAPSQYQCQFFLLLFPSDGGTSVPTRGPSIDHSKPCHAGGSHPNNYLFIHRVVGTASLSLCRLRHILIFAQ